jgi:two-component system, OmpR family, sensor histidine kinase ChvG
LNGALQQLAKRHWPALRLRAILFGVLLFTAAMPGLAAVGLRVYENALVRQTEAELVAQGAALAAVAALEWAGAPPPPARPAKPPPGYYAPEFTTIDLSRTPVLPERPPMPAVFPRPDPDALAVSRTLTPVIERTVRTTLASVVILDSRGVQVARGRSGASYASLPEVRAALSGTPRTVMRRNGDYRPRYRFEWLSRASYIRLHHARPVLVGGEVKGVLLLSRSPRALFRGIYEDRGKIALGIGVIFGILLVLAGVVSRGVTRPIEELSAASREVATGGGRIPETPPTAAVEIRALYEDFRAMAERIERRSGYLRDFAAAVSQDAAGGDHGRDRAAAGPLRDHVRRRAAALPGQHRRRLGSAVAARRTPARPGPR